MIRTVASFIPPAWRTAIYSVLGALILLEQVWDIVPEPFEGKLLATLSVLGFAMAGVNALPDKPLPPPPAGGVPEQFPGEFA